jgi:membrane protein
MPAMPWFPQLRVAWRKQLAELLATARTWPWRNTLKTLRIRFREDRLGLIASSLTFTTIISLVPLATVMLALFAAFPIFATFQEGLQKYFLQSLVPASIAQPVLGALTEFASNANRLGSAGLVVLVLAALALMLTIDRALNAIWRVRQPRPIAQRVLVYWAAVTLGPLLVGISTSATSYAVSASRGWIGYAPAGRMGMVFGPIEFVLLTAGLAGLFHYVPNTHVRWRHAIAGALFAAAGFELAKKLLAAYLTLVPSYRMIYGAFAFVPILLVWIYLAWVVVLLGAVIAAYGPSLAMRARRWPDDPGARLHLALSVLRELAQAHAKGRRGVAAGAIAEALATDPLQIEPILATLIAFDWVGRLDESSDPRFVLLCDPGATPAQPLLSLLLMQPTAAPGLWRRAGFDTMTLHELLVAA